MILKYSTICFLFILGIFISSCTTEISLVKNHTSEYTIVIPSEAAGIERHSAEELQKYLQEITGTKLKIVSDSEPETEYEILIGRNSRLKKLGININFDSLALDGFTIRTVGNKLIIAGGSKKGTLYGVYTFLEKYLGCKMYTPDDIYIPKEPEIIIPKINLTEVPKILSIILRLA
jgi:alpha-glucuronidase